MTCLLAIRLVKSLILGIKMKFSCNMINRQFGHNEGDFCQAFADNGTEFHNHHFRNPDLP